MGTKGEIILYTTADGKSNIEVRLDGDSVWLTADEMAVLYQRSASNISRHIRNIFDSGELEEARVAESYSVERNEGNRIVRRDVVCYNLDMIIAVGYRVNSPLGTRFRQWATSVLREYMVKGFALNDDLLKNAGSSNYFDELLARIRDIRSSEKVFYRKVLQIYALSIDYDPRSETTQRFFRTVQNKIHFSAHGHTAAEIVFDRADAMKDFMGLTSWKGLLPTREEAEVAKNYLSAEELDTLNRIVSLYLDFAELQARNHVPMYMKDWIEKLDGFLTLSGRELLDHAGKVSARMAKEKADSEFVKFKERVTTELSPVEIHFIDAFEAEQRRIAEARKKEIK